MFDTEESDFEHVAEKKNLLDLRDRFLNLKPQQ